MPLLTVGRIDKAHGVKGEVLVSLVTDRVERLAPGTVLTAGSRLLEVVSSTPHHHRFIVRFAGVGRREEADALRGVELSAEPIDDPDVLWVHDLIGSEVVDTEGVLLGTIESVENNPASDLLVLVGGGLVPMTFVVGSEPGRVTVDPPLGLLDP